VAVIPARTNRRQEAITRIRRIAAIIPETSTNNLD
jgi:hypothetical protein